LIISNVDRASLRPQATRSWPSRSTPPSLHRPGTSGPTSPAYADFEYALADLERHLPAPNKGDILHSRPEYSSTDVVPARSVGLATDVDQPAQVGRRLGRHAGAQGPRRTHDSRIEVASMAEFRGLASGPSSRRGKICVSADGPRHPTGAGHENRGRRHDPASTDSISRSLATLQTAGRGCEQATWSWPVRFGLSATPCMQRVRRMEAAAYIRRLWRATCNSTAMPATSVGVHRDYAAPAIHRPQDFLKFSAASRRSAAPPLASW